MKKNLWYILALLCSLNIFSACSDDEQDRNEEQSSKDWADYIATFSTTNKLTLNGAENTNKEREVIVAEGTNGKAKVTLKNIVIETSVLEFDGVEIKEQTNGSYAFTATQQIAESEVTITGTLIPDTESETNPISTLSLNVSRKIVSALVGDWHLTFNEESTEAGFGFTWQLKEELDEATRAALKNVLTQGLAELSDEEAEAMINSGAWRELINETLDAILNGYLKLLFNIPELIAEKVEDVTVSFTEKGIIDISWTSIEGTQVTLSEALSNLNIAGMDLSGLQALTLEYYIENGKIFVGIDKTCLNLISFLPTFIPAIEPYEFVLSMVTGLFTVQSNYACLPLNTKKNDTANIFSLPISSTALSPLFSMIDEILPEEFLQGDFGPIIQAMLTGIIVSIDLTETINIELEFVK